MDAIWTGPNDLVDRIDAEYYRPEFVEASNRLAEHVPALPLSEIWEEANRIYIGIAGFETVDSPDDYTPYLRPVDISEEGGINYDKLPWCKKSWLDDHAQRVCAKPGDLIIEVKVNTRKVAVVSNRIPSNCVVSGSSYRVHLKSQYDPYFVRAFLSTEIGQRLKRRLTSNINISYIDPDSFRNFRVPAPSTAVQRAIGIRVRAAELLRERAESRVAAGRAEIESALGWPIPLDPSEMAFVDPDVLSYRLDPLPYLPRFTAVRSLIESHDARSLHDLGASASNGCEVRDFVSDGRRYLLVGDMESWHLKSPSALNCIPSASNVPKKAIPREGDLLCVRTGPVGQMVSWEPVYGDAVLSSHWIRIRGDVNKGFDAGYFALFSQCPAWQILMQAIVYGAVQPQISQEEILAIPIPFVGTDLSRRCGESYRIAVSEAFRAKELSALAIVDVENLVDGRFDERKCFTDASLLADEFGLEVPQ